jgi:alkylation response protein AidB-like acyl-CoA dehydrogenase
VARTAWVGFREDVAVRVRPDGDGTVVDVRSASRYFRHDLGGNAERIADARIAIDQVRLLVLRTAWLLDTEGLAGARSEVSQIKVAAPRVAQDVVDLAIQLHGGGGLSSDHPLAAAWTSARSLRLADGPDEVHRALIARLELSRLGIASDRRGARA